MVNGINGNGQVSGNNAYYGFGFPGQVKTEVTEQINVADNKVKGEYGDKLLDQVQSRCVEASRIPEEDVADLAVLSDLAGIKGIRRPTVAQYASIAGFTLATEKDIDKLTTTNNMTDYFNNAPEIAILDNLVQG